MLDNKNNFFRQNNNEEEETIHPFQSQITEVDEYEQFNQHSYSNDYASNVNSHYPYMESKPKKAKSNKKFLGFAAAVVSLSFVFSLMGTALGNSLFPQNTPIVTAQEQDTSATEPKQEESIIKTAVSDGEALTVEQVAELASKSVVEITTESLTTGNRMQQYVSTGAGSGVIISADGYIVTNNHVIADSTKITVTLKDGTQHQATLVGTDPKTDIAVIKITATGLSPATLGSSSSLKVGQEAIAIGNPLGQLGGTVTTGIISALDREITIDGEVMNLLQTNAAINPGNSGGGLFNNKGELIGVVNAKSSGSDVEGLGFAIPVDTAKPIIESLIKNGYVEGRVELGLSLMDIEDELTAMMYRVNSTGVYVLSVEPSSSAANAGLQAGDKIITFDNAQIKSSTEIAALLDKHAVGDQIAVTVERGGRQGSVTITLQEQKIGTVA